MPDRSELQRHILLDNERDRTTRWRMMDLTHNYLSLEAQGRKKDIKHLHQRAFLRAQHPLVGPINRLSERYSLPFETDLRFKRKKVITLLSHQILPGDSIPVISHEGRFSSLLHWPNWDERFKKMRALGLDYATCQYWMTHFLVAYRDKPAEGQVASRAWSMTSRWLVSPEARKWYGLDESTEHLTISAPAIDGIGYDIGRKGKDNYSHATRQEIAYANTRGVFLMDEPDSLPVNEETMIQAAWIPGTFAGSSPEELAESTSHTAFSDLGFSSYQVEDIEGPSRLYTRVMDRRGMRTPNANMLELLSGIKDVWTQIKTMPQLPIEEVPEDVY